MILPAALRAQEVVQQPSPDADALAADMRLLASNPQDLNALIRAGELTLRMGDTTAAAGFFARAGRIDPRNARVKAGLGGLLILSERPGEALRRFGEAEQLGLDPRTFAAERGLAYDLIGEQDRAQREYRLALKAGPDDETSRRYALSLGIAGKRDAALEQLDTLLRKSDRGAWRTRAFILAMTGDVAGANKIATSMMPGGMAQGLQPFFERLPTLGPVDRAFAVHFGETRPSADRLADARMVPQLPALLPEASRPVAVAANTAAARIDARQEKRDRKKRNQKVQLAATTTPPPVPLPPVPTYVAAQDPSRGAPPVAMAANRPAYGLSPAPLSSGLTNSRVTSAQPQVRTITPAAETNTRVSPQTMTSQMIEAARADRMARQPAATAQVMPAANPPPAQMPQPRSTIVASAPAPVATAVTPRVTVAPAPRPELTSPRIEARQPANIAPSTPAASIPAPAIAVPAGNVTTPAAPAVMASTQTAASAAVSPTPAPVRVVSPPRTMSEDTILARIVANISVPAAELDVAPPAGRAQAVPVPTPGAATPATTIAPVVPEADRKLAETRAAAAQKAQDERAATERKLADAKAAAAEKKLADAAAAKEKKAAAAKLAADKKAIAEKKAAAEKKLADRKAAAEAKADPVRYWVQVSGGANVDDLPKAWSRLREKAPTLLKARSGWTTPLRATNRLLTGPFKTADEAQDFVNALGKAGVSGFTFTSEAGQKVAKLPAK